MVEVLDTRFGEFSVTLKCNHILDSFQWMFTTIYGPHETNSRNRLWSELANI